MWKRQLSPSPMLPSEAAMPPCAATVWLRVGNTFVTQAVRSPDAAMPSAARIPAPPAPTRTTSKLCSIISVRSVIVLLPAVGPDDLRIGVSSETRSLRHRNPAGLGAQLAPIDLRFKVEPSPFYHGVGGAERSGCMDRRQQTRAIIKGVRHHRDVMNGRKRKDFAQFANASHLGGARLTKVNALRAHRRSKII